MSKIRLSGVVEESITDGPGIRFSVFTQGCPHCCKGCHNPQTWELDGGYFKDSKELLIEIKKNPLIKGVTISGGEPLIQGEALLPFLKGLKEAGYHVCIFTGFLMEQVMGDPVMSLLLPYTDILIDGPFIKEQRNLDLKFRGSQNQRVIDVKETLFTGKIKFSNDPDWIEF